MPTATYPSVIQRYYKKFFDKRADRPDEDVCVLVHSNKVCIVTLSPHHKALKNGPIKSVNYLVETEGKKVGDVHGKRKLQAIKTRTGMPLCEITSGDGTTYLIKCPVRGKLCELNDKLLKDLTLLDNMTETNGYLAIILHYHCDEKDICSFLLTEEQFLNGEEIQPVAKKTAVIDVDASSLDDAKKAVIDVDGSEEGKVDGNKETLEALNADVSKPADEGNMEVDTKEVVKEIEKDGERTVVPVEKPAGEESNMEVDTKEVVTEAKVDEKQKPEVESTEDGAAAGEKIEDEKDEVEEEDEVGKGKKRGGRPPKKTPAKRNRR